MKPTSLLAAVCAALLFAPSLVGHGGGHLPPGKPAGGTNTGPGDTVPPIGGGGGGGPSGPSTPGPSTPGPAGPRPTGGAPGPQTPGPAQPATPGGGGPANPGSSSGPSTGAPMAAAIDLSAWSVWWELNQHRFLDLRRAIWRGVAETQTDEFYLGQGGGRTSPEALRPSDALIAERVLPALREVLASEKQPTVLSGCLTALAKGGATASAQEVARCEAALVDFLDDASQQLRETAALCLGILGAPDAGLLLASLLADDERGRELSGKQRVAERTRAFAAYGLGVLAQRSPRIDVRSYAAHQLVRALDAELGSHELASACINALAMIELERREVDREREDALPPAASREALSAYMRARFEDRKLDERARGHVPRALARWIEPPDDPLAEEVLGALLDPLERSSRYRRETVHGAIAALGTVELAADEALERKVLAQLERAFTDGDSLGRGLALIALAEVASRPGVPDEVLAGARARLVEVLAKGRSRERPWAALALGVLGHRLRALGVPLSAEIDRALRVGLEETGSPSDVGAWAIALGLRGAVSCSDVVLERLDELRDDEARGHMALALGLMRERSAAERLRALVEEARYRPVLLRDLGVALALLDDENLVPRLVQATAETTSSSMRAVLAYCLAHVGDARAVDLLLTLLQDEDSPELTRGIAALGLGITCERTPLPWNAELARDVNYAAAPPSLYDPTGGGVLNIR